MGFLVLSILLVAFSWLIYRISQKSSLDFRYLGGGWLIKLIFSGIFYLVSAYHYGDGQLTGDAENFFNDGKVLTDLAQSQPGVYWEVFIGSSADDLDLRLNELSETRIWDHGENGDMINDNRLMIRLQSLIHFISFENVFVHLLVMTFISFMGIFFLFRAFEKYVERKTFFFLALCCFPSIAFWGGGLAKESLMIFGIGLYLFSLFRLLEQRNLFHHLINLIAILLLLYNKPYVGLILIPCSLILLGGKSLQWKPRLLYGWSALILIGGTVLCFTPKSYNLINKVSSKQQDLINISKGGIFFITDSSFCAFNYDYKDHFEIQDRSIKVNQNTAGEFKRFGSDIFYPFTIPASPQFYDLYLVQAPSNSYVDVTPVENSGFQLLKNIPSAFFNTLLRPLPGDVKNYLSYPVTVQNIALLGFLIFAFFRRKKLDGEQTYLIYLLVSSSLLILLLIGWTTPILGAIFRYKVAAELLLIIAAFIYVKPSKTQQK